MKTRIIHTHFWTDSYIYECSPVEKLIYVFFLTNDKVNMCGIYEITGPEVSFYTGIPLEEVKACTRKFQADHKMFFWKSWVGIVNHDKYNSYGNGDRQLPAFKRELDYVPKDFWTAMSEWDTSIHTSIYTRLNTKYQIPNPYNKIQTQVLSDEEIDKIAAAIDTE